MKPVEKTPLEKNLRIFLEKSKEIPCLSIEEILAILSGKGRSLTLLFLCLPFCLPIQIPGLSIPFGLVIGFIGLRMAFAKHFWLPKTVLSKKISSETIQKITQKILWMVDKMKRFIHPRLLWICAPGIFNVINGLLVFFLGIFLAIPLPIPLTNLLVGWALLFLSLGLLENDGLFVILAYFMTVITIAFFVFVFFSIEHTLLKHILN